MKVATARPFTVCVSAGWTLPSVVVKRTVVPFWTAVPLDSVTNAVSPVLPFNGTTRVDADSAIVELVGASSGTLSQAAAAAASRTTIAVSVTLSLISPNPRNVFRPAPVDRIRS